MAKLKVLAGDFKKAKFVGGGTLTGNRTAFVFPVPFTLDEFRRRNPDARYDWQANTVTYPMSLVKTLEEVTEENKVRVLGAAGWGAVGAIALGPVGALGAAAGLTAGLILGGMGKSVVFAIEFNDGKRALIEANQKVWKRIVASRF